MKGVVGDIVSVIGLTNEAFAHSLQTLLQILIQDSAKNDPATKLDTLKCFVILTIGLSKLVNSISHYGIILHMYYTFFSISEKCNYVWTSVAKPDSQSRNGKFDRGMESKPEIFFIPGPFTFQPYRCIFSSI